MQHLHLQVVTTHKIINIRIIGCIKNPIYVVSSREVTAFTRVIRDGNSIRVIGFVIAATLSRNFQPHLIRFRHNTVGTNPHPDEVLQIQWEIA